MRINNFFLRFSLIALILLSMVLSYLIWTNNARYQGEATTTDPAAEQAETAMEKQIGDVFVPTKVISNPVGQKFLVFNRKDNIVTDIRNEMRDWEITKIQKKTPITSESYMDLLNQKRTLQLVYPSEVTMALFGQVFNQKINGKQANLKIDRILILEAASSDSMRLFLMNDSTLTVYETTVKKESLTKIKQIIRNKNNTQTPLTEQLFNGQPMIFYQSGISLTPFNYLISKQSSSYYVTNLLGTSNASNVDTQHPAEDETVYQNGTSESLSFFSKSGLVDYVNYDQSTENRSSNDTQYLQSSFKDLLHLGNTSLSGIRFFDYNSTDHRITYRNYVDDYPIFHQIMPGQVDDGSGLGAATIQDSKTFKKIDFSVFSLQVPLPLDNEKISLPSTQSILDKILTAGAKQGNLAKIQLGYRWTTDPDSDMVIELVPTYYVLYTGKWYEYQDLIATLGKGGVA